MPSRGPLQSQATALWQHGSANQWAAHLDCYPAALKEKARLNLARIKKPKPVPAGQDQRGRVVLDELDKQLDAEVRGLVETGTLSKQHLQKCFDWKMQRGMDRTNLLGSKVANLTDEHVRAAYDSAFRLLPEGAVPAADHLKLVRSVVAKLTKPLLGVGPAMASVMLSMARPDIFPFYGDEAEAAMGLAETKGADDKKYADMCVQCAAKATSLAAEWTAAKVERSLFAASYLPLDSAPSSAVKRAAEDDRQTDDEQGESAAKKSKTAE